MFQIWDSYRPWAFEYINLCHEKMKNKKYAKMNEFRQFLEEFNCNDRWHAGWYLTIPLAKLLANHVCHQAGVTKSHVLQQNFVKLR